MSLEIFRIQLVVTQLLLARSSTWVILHHVHAIQCPSLIYVMSVWSGLVGGFLSIYFLIHVWLVCYARVFHAYVRVYILSC